jgi:hypothetical protein
VTAKEFRQNFNLSLGAIRRLGFGSEEQNLAAHTLLTAIGLYGCLLQHENGYWLRSNCDLYQTGSTVDFTIQGTGEVVTLDLGQARTMLDQALAEAQAVGVGWKTGAKLELRPSVKLLQIVKESQSGSKKDKAAKAAKGAV